MSSTPTTSHAFSRHGLGPHGLTSAIKFLFTKLFLLPLRCLPPRHIAEEEKEVAGVTIDAVYQFLKLLIVSFCGRLLKYTSDKCVRSLNVFALKCFEVL